MKSQKTGTVGAVLSLACLVHCALVPLLGATLPLLSFAWFASSEAIEIGMIATAVCFCTFSLFTGWRFHRQWQPTFVFFVALSFIVASHFFHGIETMHILGSIILLGAHYTNRYFCERCPNCNPYPESNP